MTRLSVLDLSPIVEGADASAALKNTLDLARHAERLGYTRFWLAEHHNMPGIASAATAVVIGHVAAGTKTIRVGAGGVMLPNHAPLVIAEQFGTLEALFPGRIDLGLGRAPGTDQLTAHALRRTLDGSPEDFPMDVLELQGYFRAAKPGQPVRAVPGAGLNVPLWLLGSSLFSAQLAARLGLPFSFASHFAPALVHDALAVYRGTFRPSEQLQEPYAMLGINVVVADTDREAQRLMTSAQQQFVDLRRGRPGPLKPPRDSMDDYWSAGEKAMVDEALAAAVVGSPTTVKAKLTRFAEQTQADELIVTSHLYDHQARLRSYELLAELRQARVC